MPEDRDETFEGVARALRGRYRLERECGAGGMASVYLAEDLKHHRNVAVKVLRPELAAAVGTQRFLLEIDIAARLHHPHVLPLYDSGEADGFVYFVMPFVEGESLRDRLHREKQLPLDEALQIAREVADALSFAHGHDVVHRDIKPENILLEAGHAVVADFGIARAITAAAGERLTQTGIAVGTPAYMSPEQAVGSKDLDGRSDLYSLGCVLYEMLAGQPPFTGPTVESVVHQHLTAEARSITQIRPAVPAEVAAALARALAKTPADRFNPVGQFAEALGRGGPAGRPTDGRGARASAPLRRYGAGVAAAVGVVGLLMVALLVRRGPPNVLQLGRRAQVTLDPGLELDPALSPDGRFIAYTTGTGLVVRQVDGGTPIQVVRDQGGAVRWPFWAPDGRRIFFFSRRGIEIAPALGGASRVLVAAAGANLAPGGAIAPDGRSFVFASRDSVYVKPVDGGEERLVTVGRELHSFAWSPDGRLIAYVSGNAAYVRSNYLGNIAPSSIRVVPAAGGTSVRVTDEQALNVSPTWAWDGSLLYVSSRDGGRDVYQVTLKPSGEVAGPPVRLTTGLSAYGISLSADGTRLAYAAFTETSNVWSVAIASTGAVSVSHAVPVTTGNQTIEGFDISPDGQWLAFDSNRSGTQQIYRVRLTGGEPEQLTRASADAFYPAWSPDGREIAFHSFRAGHRQVFVLSAEGGTPVQVTKGADDERAPSWAPDGRRLLTVANWATHPQLHVFTRTTDGRWSAPETLPVVVKSDTVPAGVSEWSTDGRSIACRCANDGLVIVPAAGGPARSIVPASPSPPVSVFPHWSAGGPLVYYLADESPNASVKVVPASGGAPRVVVRFDDPTRPWHRFGFRIRAGRAYFTLGDLQSDIWVAEVARSK